jgi:hypothetical protein
VPAKKTLKPKSKARKSPVSAAFVLSGSGPVTVAARIALRAIDRVHDDGELPNLLIEAAPKMRTAVGEYIQCHGRGEKIRIKPTKQAAFTAVHEIGHYIDHQVLDDGVRGFASESSRRVQEILRAAVSTTRGNNLRRIGRKFPGVARWREVFARAYSQYIAIKSGDPELLAGLNSDRAGLFGEVLYWNDKDFSAIMELLDFFFKEKGWL